MKLSLLKRYEFILVVIILITGITFLIPVDFIKFRGATTFLPPLTIFFGIVVGFSVYTAWNESIALREAILEDDAIIKQLHNFAELFSSKELEHLEGLLDELFVLGYSVGWKNLKKCDNVIDKTIDYINSFSPKTTKQEDAYKEMIKLTTDWQKIRGKIYAIGESRMVDVQWFLLNVLAFAVLINLFALKTAYVESYIVTVVVSTAVVLTLMFIKDLKEHGFGSIIWSQSDAEYYEHLFDFIKKPYFYPKELIDKEMIIPKSEKYRTEVPASYAQALT